VYFAKNLRRFESFEPPILPVGLLVAASTLDQIPTAISKLQGKVVELRGHIQDQDKEVRMTPGRSKLKAFRATTNGGRGMKMAMRFWRCRS
jgi:hypothetical protein